MARPPGLTANADGRARVGTRVPSAVTGDHAEAVTAAFRRPPADHVHAADWLQAIRMAHERSPSSEDRESDGCLAGIVEDAKAKQHPVTSSACGTVCVHAWS